MHVREGSFVWRGVVKINRILMKEPSVMDSRLKKYELFKMNTLFTSSKHKRIL